MTVGWQLLLPLVVGCSDTQTPVGDDQPLTKRNATPVVTNSAQEATVVPEDGNHEREADLSTPEAAVRAFLLAVVESDENRIRQVTVPNPDLSILWQAKRPPPDVFESMRNYYRSVPLRCLKVGETVVYPRGKKVVLGERDINATRQQVTHPDNPIPFFVVQVDGQWKVDAWTVIAVRKATPKSRQERGERDREGDANGKPSK